MESNGLSRNPSRLGRIVITFAIILVAAITCLIIGLILQDLILTVTGAVVAVILGLLGIILITPHHTTTKVGVVGGKAEIKGSGQP
jgi:fatty acid desaturase